MRRRNSLRLPFYDYSQPGQYFITTVVKNRTDYFGLPHNKSVEERLLRTIVETTWKSLFDNVSCSIHHVLMPNHFHAIIDIHQDSQHEIDHADHKQRRKMKIPRLMGKFKMLSSKAINDYFQSQGLGRPFKWQERYFDRIIRNERELQNVYDYIENNPMAWEGDILNNKNYDHKKIKKFFHSL